MPSSAAPSSSRRARTSSTFWADRLEEFLTASLKNLANLARVARWERFLLPTIDTQLLSSHATLLFDLAHNLHRRNEAKRAFDRGAAAHKR